MALLDPGLVVDRYKVQGRIGAGAMGDVYLAIDEGLGRRVALKILAEMHRENPELRARFVREARAVAAISHPNVVQVFTTGEHDGRPYLAMEYLDGRDLGSLVKEAGPLDSVTAADMIHQAASGLHAAARAGLIHRDVKPSNLMRVEGGIIKVTDFGLAKPMEGEAAAGPALTAMGIVVGTPDYIAPEQARGDPIDFRVDVYSLGCTLFYLLTGRPPFRKGTDTEDKYIKVVARHLRDPAPDSRTEAPATDPDLAMLQLQMMAKQADRRPSYEEVIKRTRKIHERLAGTSSTPVPVPVVEAGPKQTTRELPAETPPPPAPAPAPAPRPTFDDEREPSLGSLEMARARPTRWLMIVTALSALVFLTGFGLLLFGPKHSGGGAAVVVPDARPPPPDAAPPPPPEPPEGMVYVPRLGAEPGFFVDRTAISNAAYAEKVKTHRFAKAAADRPVTGVSYPQAKAYAQKRGKRLLRADEWERALAADRFAPAGMRIWEWVDDGNAAAKDRPVRKGTESARRPPAGRPDLTFRLALDAPE